MLMPLSPDFVSVGGVAVLEMKPASPLYMTSSGILSTVLGLTVNIASPPLRVTVPRFVVPGFIAAIFIPIFMPAFSLAGIIISNVTVPVGTPLPELGLTTAINSTDTN